MLGRVACVDALGRKRASVDGTGRVYGKTGGFGLDRGGAVHPRCARTDSAVLPVREPEWASPDRRVEPEPVNEGKTVKRDAVRRRAALKTGFDAAPVGRTRLHRSSRIGRGSVRQSAGRDTGLSAQKTGESFGV